MADVSCVESKAASKQPKSENYDPTLDFFSDEFDPLKALNTPGLVPPVANARAFDNLCLYTSANKQKSADREPKEKKIQTQTEVAERRWLPHQLPVQSKRKKLRNILTRMEKITGPLQVLRKCIEERLQVKVWIRNAAGIRGFCTGFVTVFDKHWNLCLEDVTEVWTRNKKRKIPPLQDKRDKEPKSRNRIQLPEVKIIKSDKKTETCERHIPQLVIRGEQVALISVAIVK